MPQMSPLLWGNLFIIFSTIIFLASTKMYFSYSKKLETTAPINYSAMKPFHWLW